MTPTPHRATSHLYVEEGQTWLIASPGHAINEAWLEEHTPDLYAAWWAAPSLDARDELARRIELRVDEYMRPGPEPPRARPPAPRVARRRADGITRPSRAR